MKTSPISVGFFGRLRYDTTSTNFPNLLCLSFDKEPLFCKVLWPSMMGHND